jgi:hypothetical protein
LKVLVSFGETLAHPREIGQVTGSHRKIEALTVQPAIQRKLIKPARKIEELAVDVTGL